MGWAKAEFWIPTWAQSERESKKDDGGIDSLPAIDNSKK